MAARHMGHRPEEKTMSRLHGRIGLGGVITVRSSGSGMTHAAVQVH
jgi:hypothetical protein